MKFGIFCILVFSANCSTDKAATRRDLLHNNTLGDWELVTATDRVEAVINKDLFSWNGTVLHVLGNGSDGSPKPFAYLRSKQAFSNYRLRLEFRWGSKRFAPRQHERRDSGVLVHVHGRHIVWPDAVELQIQEGDVGDAFTIDTQITASVTPFSVKDHATMPESTYSPTGTLHTQGHDGLTRITKSLNAERPGWNEVQVIACADQLWFIVNGTVVNQLTKVRTWRPDATGKESWIPLSSGHIALQAEGAEVFYKDMSIETLKSYEGIDCR